LRGTTRPINCFRFIAATAGKFHVLITKKTTGQTWPSGWLSLKVARTAKIAFRDNSPYCSHRRHAPRFPSMILFLAMSVRRQGSGHGKYKDNTNAHWCGNNPTVRNRLWTWIDEPADNGNFGTRADYFDRVRM
jgi:hypothetical protein